MIYNESLILKSPKKLTLSTNVFDDFFIDNTYIYYFTYCNRYHNLTKRRPKGVVLTWLTIKIIKLEYCK